ncbi:MAG: adenosylcobinamide-GDP ribazoletransferase [Cyanophyceae cyanobacterium]
MKRSILFLIIQQVKQLIKSLGGAVIFYTTIPIPSRFATLERVARWAPLVGLLIGSLLSLLDTMLNYLEMPLLTRSALVVAVWIALTGGLHLDGAIDTADGLAVRDPQKRIAVMQESVTGAFGVMAAAVLLLLKTAALGSIIDERWLGLTASAGWGRWGQVSAIAFYPYLKPTGKGAFHKQTFCLPADLLWGLVCMVGLSGFYLLLKPNQWLLGLSITAAGLALSLLVNFWFGQQFKGHTGDTYGAIVEWTEALLLCLYTCLS